jgi:hypothetical protein
MKIISYSIFGYNKERQAGCDNFNGYLYGLMINLRLARLLFPDWKVRVHLDQNTYNGLQRFWELLQPPHSERLQIVICEETELTKAMLWRMLPAFDDKVEMFICRDTDAPLTYRDAQAVKEWELSTKQAHAITDSVSHTIPMMGGMIGFKNQYFKDYTGYTNWESMVNQMSGYQTKGVDQDFLLKFIYPKFASQSNSSIMQHYFLGMPNTFIDGWRRCDCPQTIGHNDNCPLNIKLNLPEEYKETNLICGHIGAAGNYQIPTYNFLRRYKDNFKDIQAAEAILPNIFNWDI